MKQTKLGLHLAIGLAAALLALPAAAQVQDYKQIHYPPLPEFKIAKPEVFKLSNGMTVFLMEDHELPLVNVIARIRTGTNYDPAAKTGLGDIVGQVQREGGTTKMAGDEIDDFLEARAASVETGMSEDLGTASMNCLKQDFDDVLNVFHDVLRTPSFAQDKLELAKVQANTSIARRNDSISAIAGREISRLVYGPDSPLSRLTEYSTIAAIKRDDLIAWHKKYYHPNNVYLGVVGDFDPKAMRQKLEQKFGNWAAGPAFNEPEVPYQKAGKPGVYFIEKTDVTQAYVRMAHLGIRYDDPDYFATQVMNEVLGGGFASRLFSNVRSKKGLAYNVFGGVGASYLRPGMFTVGLSSKSSTMAESVEALKQEIQGIIDNPPNDAEMQRSKEAILNSFVFNYASKGQILAQQMTYAYYGMPADFLDRYRSNVEKVTREDVARVAKKYIHPDKLKLLVVGKSADFDRPVSSFGTVEIVDIRVPDPPDATPAVEKTAAGMKAGMDLLTRAARSFDGGKSTKVQSLQADYTMDLSMGGQVMSASQSVTFVLPDKILHVIKLPMGEQKTVINGGRGVASMGGRSMPIPEDRAQEASKQFGRDLRFLLGNLDSPDLEAVAAGSEEVDGLHCDVVSVRFHGMESRLSVAPDGRVVKQSFQGKHPMTQAPGRVEIRYSDFRQVDGRLIPHQETMTIDGQEVMKLTLKSIHINPSVDAQEFELPAAA